MGQVSGVGTRRGAAGGYLPGLDVECGLGNVARWIQHSVSKATWDAYSKIWQDWLTCLHGLEIDPAGREVPQAILYFINMGFERGISAAAIDGKLAGLAFLFKLQGLRDHTKDFWVKQAVKGYRKEHRKSDGRRPVSFDMLHGLFRQVSYICSSEFESALFRAAFALAFFGALRVSELVSPSKRAKGGLQCEDLEFSTASVRIWIKRSKTDQMGKGAQLEVFRIAGSHICPVAAVTCFRDRRPPLPGSFLIRADGSSLSKFQFAAVFKKCLSAAGHDPNRYSSHSFRIGAATEAARAGLSVETVKRIGRWDSDRFKLYIRPHLL